MDRLEKLLQIIKIQPDSSFVKFGIAKEYENINNFQEAVIWYQKLLNDDPDYTGTYYHLSNLKMKLDQQKEALECIEKGIVRCKALKSDHDLAELTNLKMNIQLGEWESN